MARRYWDTPARSWTRYPEQSTRQRERAARYENHTSHTGHVTHGLKPGRERALVAKTGGR